MGRSTFWQQLKALTRRNLLLKRRNKQQTIQEFLLPIYFILLLALIRYLTTPKASPAISNTKTYPLTLFPIDTNKVLYVSPNTPETRDAIGRLALLLELDSTPAFFNTPDEAESSYKNNAAQVLAGVDFVARPQDLQYTLRLPANVLASTKLIYSGQGQCREGAGLEDSVTKCLANTYLYSSFARIQVALDTVLIQMRAPSSLNVSSPSVSVQLFPKTEMHPNIHTFQALSSIYFVLAYSIFISFLTVNLVAEKEKKIKEAMRMMGMRDSAFWLSWGLVYFFIILVVTVVVTLLALLLQFFKNSNIFLFFLLLMFYGLSIINLSFALTPFFNRADTGGAMASLATIIMSLLYLLVLYTRGPTGELGIPIWAMYLLCLLSPFTLSIAIDKSIILDIAYGGMNFTTINIGEFPLSTMLIMLVVDVVLYGLLAFYFDNVIPNEYGMARPPWFFMVSAYWWPKKARYLEEVGLVEHAQSGLNELPTVTADTDTMEAVPPDFRNKNMLRIFDMHKVFKSKDKEIHAVNGISLDIYEGQITALLGHNGAGKTTLIHMLTGMTPATSGSATIYGLDVSDSNELTEVRTMIGLCPQHNILFDDLTPQEHLEFYGNLKGIPENRVTAEVCSALRTIDLSDQAKTMSKQLSGGQKRKLCVAIALIGDPKVVFLDEPTAGMDPSSRRDLWRLLKQQRNKLIVLTTHFMDEADILADRKAIISKGRLQCVGSSLFLKNRFGIGYHLNMVLEPTANVEAIEEMVKSHVTTAKAQRHHGKELTFTLPMTSVSAFPQLFGALDENVDANKDRSSKLGIYSYGVSMTSLEEVFLKLGEEGESDDPVPNTGANPQTAHTPLNVSDVGHINYATTTPMDTNDAAPRRGVNFQPRISDVNAAYVLSPKQLAYQQINALLKIRLLLLTRNIPKFVFQVFLPILYMIGGAAMMRFLPSEAPLKPTSLQLQPSMYADSAIGPGNPTMLYNYLTESNVTAFNASLHQQGVQLSPFNNVSSLLKIAPHYIGLEITNITNTAKMLSSAATMVYNSSAVHSIPATINALTSTLLNMTGSPETIITYSKPWPWLFQSSTGFNAAIFGSSLLFGIALASIPGGFGTNIIVDRISKVKSQLRLAGVSMNMYWGTVLAFDAIQLSMACLIMLIIILAFQIPTMSTAGAILCIILCYIGYIPGNIFTSYNLSYCFDKVETAQSSLPNIFMWSALLPAFTVSIIDMTGNQEVAVALHYAFSVFIPPYPIIGALYFIDKVYRTAQLTQGNNPYVPVSLYFSTDSHIIIAIIMPLVHVVLLYFILRLNEVRSIGAPLRTCLQYGNINIAFPGTTISANTDIPQNEDTDVAAERLRVDQSDSQSMPEHVIRVNSLRKEFIQNQKSGRCFQWSSNLKEKRVAVRNSSFLVEAGEVFGLLGPNGAGKTTTLNMIIAETAPTCGKVDIAGHDIQSNLSLAFEEMGYCPQHDALWDHIRLREHLQCYAAVRGIPASTIPAVINYFLESLDIKEHADKKAKKLSGGTKRKLSYIMGMLGDSKVVLMDEPSTGMDPKSKRFMWDTISSAFNNSSRGAILTTHYMDEADALCSRVAIMINGQIECLGSTQHLKNKYGCGYYLEVKLQAAVTEERSLANMEALNRYIEEEFPGTICQEAFGDRAQYLVPQTNIVSLANTFNKLEEAKMALSVEEYSFSQATLEQVFLEFAKNQKEEGEAVGPLSAVTSEELLRTRSLHHQMSLQSGEITV